MASMERSLSYAMELVWAFRVRKMRYHLTVHSVERLEIPKLGPGFWGWLSGWILVLCTCC